MPLFSRKRKPSIDLHKFDVSSALKAVDGNSSLKSRNSSNADQHPNLDEIIEHFKSPPSPVADESKGDNKENLFSPTKSKHARKLSRSEKKEIQKEVKNTIMRMRSFSYPSAFSIAKDIENQNWNKRRVSNLLNLEEFLDDINESQMKALIMQLASQDLNLISQIEDQRQVFVSEFETPSTRLRVEPLRRQIDKAIESKSATLSEITEIANKERASMYAKLVTQYTKKAEEFNEGGDHTNGITILQVVTEKAIPTCFNDVDDSDHELRNAYEHLSTIWQQALSTTKLSSDQCGAIAQLFSSSQAACKHNKKIAKIFSNLKRISEEKLLDSTLEQFQE